MLGSHFDLKGEIARIAERRAAEAPTTQPPSDSDFDDKLRDFIRSLGGDTWTFDAIRTDPPPRGDTE